MRRAFTLTVRWMSKRARVHEAKTRASKDPAAPPTPNATKPAPPASATPASGAPVVPGAPAAAADAGATEIMLWQCNKQMKARLLVLAAFAQLMLGAAYLDSLWLMKKKEADVQLLQELKEGFADAKRKSPLHYLTLQDKLLAGVVFVAPFALLGSSRFSTGRWVHEIKLVSKTQAAVQTYNLMAQRTTRVMPVTNIERFASDKYGVDDERIMVAGKTFLLPKGGQMFNQDVFERTFRVRRAT